MEPVTDVEVTGAAVLRQKCSAVDAAGRLRLRPIEGVAFRPVRPVAHEDGTVAEIARTDWPEVDVPVVQVHMTTTLPGRTRAWGLHTRSTDRLFLITGLVSFVVYDGRAGSVTQGCVNEIVMSDRNPGLLVVPPNLYHGWKNIGMTEAVVLNLPTRLYEYAEPDALDLPYDAPEAATIVPHRW